MKDLLEQFIDAGSRVRVDGGTTRAVVEPPVGDSFEITVSECEVAVSDPGGDEVWVKGGGVDHSSIRTALHEFDRRVRVISHWVEGP